MENTMSQENDLAYLRSIAEEGRRAPLLGGRFSVWWGGLTALVLMLHWAVLTGIAPLGPEMLWPMWMGYVLIGAAGSVVLRLSARGKPGRGSAANRVESAVWQNTGLAIFAYFIGISIGVATGHLPPVLYNTILPAALAAYGIAWLTIARIAQRPVLALPGLISLAGTVATSALATSPWVYPMTALSLVVVSLVPGWLMLRAEPRDEIPAHG
jgi:hypothetical protein